MAELHRTPPFHPVAYSVGTTDISTTSTVFVDMPNMSVTLRTHGNPVLIVFSAMFSRDGNMFCEYRLMIDGVVRAGGIADLRMAGTYTLPAVITHTRVLTPGSHTIKIQWRVNANTVSNMPTTIPNEFHRTLTAVELIT